MVQAVTERMTADGRVEILFCLADGAIREAADGSGSCHVCVPSYALGVRGRGYYFHQFGAARYVSIRFRPGGFAAFSGSAVSEINDIFVSLDCLWETSTVRILEEQLADARHPTQQATALDNALLTHLNVPEHLPRLLDAVNNLPESRDLATLAETANLSQKHFERLFTRYIGIRPSFYARIDRFLRALRRVLNSPERMSLWRVGLTTGYYDQAHFTRDFKAFTGLSPREFLATPHGFVTRTQLHAQLSPV
jgi:AraC-like DNA-binding protein